MYVYNKWLNKSEFEKKNKKKTTTQFNCAASFGLNKF